MIIPLSSPSFSLLALSLSHPQDYGDKRITLYDIRDELSSPYKERRTPHTPLSGEEKFILVTGETPDSLYEGKLVTCTVVGIVRRKTLREVLDRANPIKNERTLLWQCPFCLQSDFRDLSLVSGSLHTSLVSTVNYKIKLHKLHDVNYIKYMM